MNHRARTPEELETLLEDSLVIGGTGALEGLFENWAVLAGAGVSPQFHGSREIAGFLTRSMEAGRLYLAGPEMVIQARNRALVITGRRANLVRRDRDGAWRYEILHLRND